MSYRSITLLASAAMLATVQFSAPARADTWSFFPWFFAPAQPEKPKVVTRTEVAPSPRRSRVAQPVTRTAEPACRSVTCGPYMVVGLGL